MTGYPALRFPAEQDLSGFVALLQRLGVPHRVTEVVGEQILWVPDEEWIGSVQRLYQQYPDGQMPLSDSPGDIVVPGKTVPFWRQAPMTVAVLAMTLVVAVFTLLGRNMDALHWLTFQDFLIQGEYVIFTPLAQTLAEGQLWRLLTPMLIHFGFLHLAMNALWYWELGRRIERVQGAWSLLWLTILFGVSANVVQFFVSGASLFGGLSGVLYGLLGHYWLYQRLAPHPSMDLPKGVLVFMLIWLVVCLTGVVDMLGFGSIANGAHVGGLVIGCCTGVIAGTRQRKRSPP